MEALRYIGMQLTPVGLLVGFITGAVLSWFARGDWEAIGEEDEDDTEFGDCGEPLDAEKATESVVLPFRQACARKEDAKPWR